MPVKKSINNFLLFFISKKKIFHLEKKVVVIINIRDVHKHLWTTSSIWPTKEKNWKYITPIIPHQSDPSDV